MEKLFPGFSQTSGKIADNIQRLVSGELPSDVERLIGQRAAERGIARGTKGSEFQDYSLLRDLGLTSLEITDRGLDAATRWMNAVNQGVAPMNFQSMFVSPAQRIATEQWNETNRFNTQFLKNQIKMLPSNMEMGLAQGMDNVATMLMTWGSMGMGSMGGGKGGMGGMGGGTGTDIGMSQDVMQQRYNMYNNYGPGY
jgi:hypothetical protein